MLSHFSHVRLCATPRTGARQAPLSMGFSRQEYWSALPFPSAGDLPDPGIELASPMSPSLAGRFFTVSATWEARRSEEWLLIGVKFPVGVIKMLYSIELMAVTVAHDYGYTNKH